MKELLVEKYRPTTLNEYVFQNSAYESKFWEYVDIGNIPNLLFSGSPGSGKTTMARVLINELNVQKNDTLIINASTESGIDSVRSKISSFCDTYPLGEFKVVLLEEADGTSPSFQRALRSLMEDVYRTCRFILTCNYHNKIIPAIKSRCTHYIMEDFNKDSIISRVRYVLESESIEFTEETLTDHVESHYPDMRKTLTSVQQSIVNGVLGGVFKTSDSQDVVEVFTQLWNEANSYDTIIEVIPYLSNESVDDLYNVMYCNINSLPDDRRKHAVAVIAEHMYRAAMVSNQVINFHACLIRIYYEN